MSKVHPSYKGCLPAYDPRIRNYYLIPAHGYASLSGVLMALLYAINHDRVQKGLPTLSVDALDSSFLTTIPQVDWSMPAPRDYLAFGI